MRRCAFLLERKYAALSQRMICVVQAKFHFREERISFLNFTDIPQVVYVTKMDKVCSDVQMDPRIMFHNEAVCEAVNKTSNVIGIPRGHIYPIINYESETTLDANFDILLLQALKQTASFADDFIDDVIGSFKAPSRWYCSIS